MVRLAADLPPTPEQIQRICTFIKRGVLLETAAASVGVSKPLLHKWLRLANKGAPGYEAFAPAIESALNELEVGLLTFVHANANKNLHAAMALFNLRFAAKYKKAAEAEAGVGEPTPSRSSAEATEAELSEAENRLLAQEEAAH